MTGMGIWMVPATETEFHVDLDFLFTTRLLQALMVGSRSYIHIHIPLSAAVEVDPVITEHTVMRILRRLLIMMAHTCRVLVTMINLLTYIRVKVWTCVPILDGFLAQYSWIY